MKLHQDARQSLNTITGYGNGYVLVNQVRYESSLVLLPEAIDVEWGAGGYAALSAEEIGRLLRFGPEIVLLGTGRQQRFPDPGVLRPLIDARIGFEIMDITAACRTYNILMAEGRRVAAALIIE